MMNWIWLGIVLISILVGAFTGRMQELTQQSFESARDAVWIALKLAGIMALWLGIMRVAQEGGLLHLVSRALQKPFRWLFPEIPEGHPAMSAMILNIGANMLGLGNAATPFGIKAMMELNTLNKYPGVATNAMCLFLAINTAGLALIPTGVMGLRAVSGSPNPAGIWLPTILASWTTAVVGIIAVKLFQRLPLFKVELLENYQAQLKPPPEVPAIPSGVALAPVGVRIFVWLVVLAFLGGAVYQFGFANPGLDFLGIVKTFFASWAVPAIMGGFLLYGLYHRVKVYECLIEGAREGFNVAVRIIPYLVAIIVAVAMFTASGAMDLLKDTVGVVTGYLGMPAEVLPMAIIRPLSGSGAFAYLGSTMTLHGPDSLIGQMVSVMQGSTETTFYVLAVYFGAVGITRIRHALAAGLVADLAGIVAAVALCHLFF